jgi:taurine--2-oxoglutarate transaminase
MPRAARSPTAKGKQYLDFSSQLMCMNLGHKNQAVIDAIKQQAQDLAYAMPGYATTARAELSKLLLEVLPKGLNKFFFTTSERTRTKRRSRLRACIRARPRSSRATAATTGRQRQHCRDRRSAPLGDGAARQGAGDLFGPEVHCYKCPIKHTYPECGIACVDYLEHMIRNESDVAAVLVEPIVGTNGVIVPPEEYMPKLRKLCDETGVLLIADEVMSGWGRAGEWFAMNLWGVTPDILTTAKGITSAYVPLGLCATSEKIGDFFQDHYFAHGHTYEAHPMTLLPAVATIHEMQRLGLVERARELEPFVGGLLQELKAKHKSVGDVRGKGLFWAVDLVKNQQTKEPFNTYTDKVSGKPLLVDQIAGKMLAEGVIMQAWVSHFVIAPPLIIEKAEIERGIAMLDKWLHLADELAD